MDKQQELQILRDTVRHYADDVNWLKREVNNAGKAEMVVYAQDGNENGYDRAREAFKRIEAMEPPADPHRRTFLECVQCGEHSFVISEANPSDGYCVAEGKVWSVKWNLPLNLNRTGR